jgi:hypothetical protein
MYSCARQREEGIHWLKDAKAPARHSCPDEGNVAYELSKLAAED